VSGAGFQGLQNLGNSCYMNSVVQLLCSLPELVSRYGTTPNGDVTHNKFVFDVTPRNATNDLLVQTAKLASALSSGVYSIPKDELDSTAPTHPKYRLAPRMFKHLIGKDHVDFRTGQQQDAAQFMQYLLEQLDRAELKHDRSSSKTSDVFAFQTQDRLVCSEDQKIKYKEHAAETVWSLRVPMEKAEVLTLPAGVEPELKRQKQEEEKDVPTVTFADCLEFWSADSTLDDYRWPHLQNAVHPATQSTRFQNFPRYLWVQIQRYQLGPDWQPIKLEVNLDIPESIDLGQFKTKEPQEGEELVPTEKESKTVASKPEISEAALGQLLDMGFAMNGCKRALLAVGGSDSEAAMNWIFEHNMDPDFNDPIPESDDDAPPSSTGSSDGVDDAVVMSLVENLGCFTIDQVRAALKETSGAADRAADWLFSHMVRHRHTPITVIYMYIYRMIADTSLLISRTIWTGRSLPWKRRTRQLNPLRKCL
jgi:ubiquitin carboxyl-terminal hydrolase 5/13